jgi:hypothetical protein
LLKLRKRRVADLGHAPGHDHGAAKALSLRLAAGEET